jgi:hypothetical protein
MTFADFIDLCETLFAITTIAICTGMILHRTFG